MKWMYLGLVEFCLMPRKTYIHGVIWFKYLDGLSSMRYFYFYNYNYSEKYNIRKINTLKELFSYTCILYSAYKTMSNAKFSAGN